MLMKSRQGGAVRSAAHGNEGKYHRGNRSVADRRQYWRGNLLVAWRALYPGGMARPTPVESWAMESTSGGAGNEKEKVYNKKEKKRKKLEILLKVAKRIFVYRCAPASKYLESIFGGAGNAKKKSVRRRKKKKNRDFAESGRANFCLSL